jgi:hypothetical protein
MRYSVSITAEGDREVSLAEVVELADAVAGLGGIASGAGTMGYGAQIVVEAATSDEAVDVALAAFATCVELAGLPAWPVSGAETLGEFDDLEEDG